MPRAAAACHIEVGGIDAHWRQNKELMFDDTWPHEVWNDTDELRCVLLIQIKRPVRWPGRLFSDLFLAAVRRTAFVQDARRNLGAWEQAYRQAEMNEVV